MQVDLLPPEILIEIVKNAHTDLDTLSKTSSSFRNVCMLDDLWQQMAETHRDRFRLRQPDQFLGYRKEHFDQLRIDTRVRGALAKLSEGSNSEALELVWRYGPRARPVLIEALYTIPTSAAAAKQVSLAKSLLHMVNHKEALQGMKAHAAAAETKSAQSMTDILATLEGFNDGHVLPPTAQELFEPLAQEVQSSGKVRTGRSKEQQALDIARVLFESESSAYRSSLALTKPSGTGRRRESVTDSPSSSHFCNMASSPNPKECSDVVNVAKFAYVGAKYGLDISPVLLAKTGSQRFVDSNFARVADPTKFDGYFVINPLSQIVLSSRDFQDMIDRQRFVRLVSGLSHPAPLSATVVSNSLLRARPRYEYETQSAHIGALSANLISALLFYPHGAPESERDAFYNLVHTSTNSKLGQDLKIDRATMEKEIESECLPSLYRELF